MNAGGALFDMTADGGQTRNLAKSLPEVAASLRQASEAWRSEMYGPDVDAKRELRNAVDPRKLGVGYPEFPATMLPARDGVPGGCIKRSSGAPNVQTLVMEIASVFRQASSASGPPSEP